MLKNYFKIAFRQLRRRPGYTFINIVGLAIGMATCLLIALFVREELRFDRFHERSDRIYRVVNQHQSENGIVHYAVTPPAMGPTLAATFPEVVQAVRFFYVGETLVQHGEQQLFEENVWLADSTVFEMFDLELVKGTPFSALAAPHTVVLSQSAARRHFGEADPVGQTLTLSEEDYTVTGVFEDWPAHSHLPVDVLGSFATLYTQVDEERLSNWIWQQFFTYLLLDDEADPELLTAKLPAFIEEHATPETSTHGFTYDTYLQPLTDIYLRSTNLQFDWGGPRGSATYVYAFSVVALLVLLIACVNFMNLATARSMKRAREVGMRKVMGAWRGQLVGQFLGESVLMAMLALVLAVALVQFTLPAFNAFAGKSMRLGASPGLVLGLIGIGVITGLIAGSYPALYLSRFRPARVLKGAGGDGPALSSLRKGLVTVQFVISIALIISAGVVYKQLDFLRTKNLGFNEESVVVLPIRGDMGDNVEAVKSELLRHPGVRAAAVSYGVPGQWTAGDDIRLPGSETTRSFGVMVVDYDFIETYQLELVAGRAFSRDFPSDETEAFLLNETGARELGWTPEEAVGQPLWWDEWIGDDIKKGTVIGVVKDFHVKSLHQPVDPLMLHMYPQVHSHLAVRLHPDALTSAMEHLERTWAVHVPDRPFEYQFLDAEIDAQYKLEEKLSRLVLLFALLAIFVACLGLFGLATYTAEQRTKEIGIRKVLGATVAGLVALLSKDFLKLVVLAFLVAAPLAYLAMNRWLEAFAYRVEIGPGVFVLAGVVAFVIALATVSFQAVKATLADPVKSLRYE